MVVERTVAREPEYLGSVGCSAIRASGRYRFSIVFDRAAQWSAVERGPLGHSSCGAKIAMQLSTCTTDVGQSRGGSQHFLWSVASADIAQCRSYGIASQTLVCTLALSAIARRESYTYTTHSQQE